MKLRILALLLALFSVFSVVAMTGCSNNSDKEQNETKDEEKGSTQKPTFSEFESTSWINALEFGFKDDGETPNDKIMKEYIKYYGTTPIYFSEGVYAFEKTISFPDNIYVYMDPGAELKCIAEEPLEFFITLQDGMEEWGSWDEYAQQSFISGGIINANYCAKVALGLHGGMHTNFENFQIRGVLEKGIQTEINELHNGCYRFTNIYLYNDKAVEGTTAIYDNTADNIYRGCTAVNFETFINTGGGKFTECSGWFNSYGKSLIKNSVYAIVRSGGQSVFSTPLVDTYRTGFKMVPTEAVDSNGQIYYNFPSTSINDLVWITNNTFYTGDLMSEYPMIIFDVPTDMCKIMVNGMYIPWREWGFRFSNIPLPSSSFLNVRYEQGWDPWNHLANFRDDTARMKEGKDLYDWSDMPTHSQWHTQYKNDLAKVVKELQQK